MEYPKAYKLLCAVIISSIYLIVITYIYAEARVEKDFSSMFVLIIGWIMAKYYGYTNPWIHKQIDRIWS